MSVLASSLSRTRSTLLDVRRCGPIGRGKRLKIVVVRVRIPLPVLARPCRCFLLVSVPFNGRVLINRGVLLLSVLSGTPRFGYVAEWFKAAVLNAVVRSLRAGGSNPSVPALERWLSGLRRTFRKRVNRCGSAGSNPVRSALCWLGVMLYELWSSVSGF